MKVSRIIRYVRETLSVELISEVTYTNRMRIEKEKIVKLVELGRGNRKDITEV